MRRLREKMQSTAERVTLMTLEEWKSNEATKVRSVVSMDCRYNDHSSCEGSESYLWPDGTSSVRQCSCVCHLEVVSAVL